MNTNASVAPVILLVEDNDDDVFLMQRALKATKLTLPLHVASDGQEALDYLGGIGQFNDRALFPLPTLVLLDLKLPYVHGFEVLNWIHQQPSLQDITIAVLTSSPEERDLQKARDLGALTYLVKPPTAEMILDLLPASCRAPAVPIAAIAPNTQSQAL